MAVATQFPTTNAVHLLHLEWTNPTNAQADDGANASANTGGAFAIIANKWGSFGFDSAVPAGATIDAVKVIIEDGLTTGIFISTEPWVSGVVQTSRIAASPEVYPVVHTIDHTADRAWTRADLLDGVLEVAVVLSGDAAGAVGLLDYVKVEVTYTVVGSTLALRFLGL